MYVYVCVCVFKFVIFCDCHRDNFLLDQLTYVVTAGEWMLVDKCQGIALVNQFDVQQVYKCLIHWGTGTVNLELWSEERPVSKDSPLRISHRYRVIKIT